MRSIFLFGVVLSGLWPASGLALTPSAPPAVQGIVTHVFDGDTLAIGDVRVRLYGVQAPELNTPAGPGAKRELDGLVRGQWVRCWSVGQPKSYGRVVARCAAGRSADLGRALVASGWAVDSARFSGGEYRAAEASARATRRGMFAR